MTVTDDFSCKPHYANTVNCMLATKTNRANPGRFASQDCNIVFNYQVLCKSRHFRATAIYVQLFEFLQLETIDLDLAFLIDLFIYLFI